VLTVAALYVARGGPYWDLPGVDPWDKRRYARQYAGPYPVVAHPPCSRWCRLAGLVEARWGHKPWAAYDLNRPPTGGGWVNADLLGGWTCYVEQFRYGHAAKKATWLYAHGVELPSLRWGRLEHGAGMALVSGCRNHVPVDEDRPRLGKKAAAETPVEFRDALLSIARSAYALRKTDPCPHR
jgi:hypothetical protein